MSVFSFFLPNKILWFSLSYVGYNISTKQEAKAKFALVANLD